MALGYSLNCIFLNMYLIFFRSEWILQYRPHVSCVYYSFGFLGNSKYCFAFAQMWPDFYFCSLYMRWSLIAQCLSLSYGGALRLGVILRLALHQVFIIIIFCNWLPIFINLRAQKKWVICGIRSSRRSLCSCCVSRNVSASSPARPGFSCQDAKPWASLPKLLYSPPSLVII